jgi:hypothetical protein
MKTSFVLALAPFVLVVACSGKSSSEPTVTDLPAAPSEPVVAGGTGTASAPPAAPPASTASDAGDAAAPAKDAAAGGAKDLACCVNNRCWSCPDKAALDKCTGFDLQGCFAACAAGDTQCLLDCTDKLDGLVPDPSDCQAKP